MDLITRLAEKGIERGHEIEKHIKVLDNRHYKPLIKEDEEGEEDNGFMSQRP